MENRSAMENPIGSEDVWTQLQQKENDLQLAAELGKALLEKNEELKRQNDALVEEYSKKLEVSHCYGRGGFGFGEIRVSFDLLLLLVPGGVFL